MTIKKHSNPDEPAFYRISAVSAAILLAVLVLLIPLPVRADCILKPSPEKVNLPAPTRRPPPVRGRAVFSGLRRRKGKLAGSFRGV